MYDIASNYGIYLIIQKRINVANTVRLIDYRLKTVDFNIVTIKKIPTSLCYTVAVLLFKTVFF